MRRPRQRGGSPAATVLLFSLLAARAHAQLAMQFEKFGPDGKVANPKCLADSCNACFKNSSPICKSIDAQCKRQLCSPMCLRLTWDCEIKVAGCGGYDRCAEFEAQANTESVKLALCAQFHAYGCSKMMGCCDHSAPWLYHWVEERTYGGFFPQPLLPLPACQVNPKDEQAAQAACDACKAAVTVTLKPMDCTFPNPTSNEKDQKPVDEAPFMNSKVVWAQQVPKHMSLQDKCYKMVELFQGAGLDGEFTPQRACECMGCCLTPEGKDPCYFPVWTYDYMLTAHR